MKKASLKSASALVTEWLGLSVGSTLTAVGIYFFEFLNHFTTGGVSGASLLLSAVIPAISASSFMLFINFLLLLIGFLVIGVDFGIRTLYCGILISLETLLLEKLFPLTEPLTETAYERVVAAAAALGITQAFVQEGEAIGASFIPKLLSADQLNWNAASTTLIFEYCF